MSDDREVSDVGNSLERPDDDALLAEVGALLRPYLVPPVSSVAAAKMLVVDRDALDGELADLVHDSLIDREPALARAVAASPRVLCFESTVLTIEFEIDDDATGGGCRLVGQLVPPQAAELELRSGGRTLRSTADEVGGFSMGGVPSGRAASLRCRLAGGTIVVTASTLL